ncbi:hypothetical protein A8F94_12625 [Bacillus sp. FJAT-27225]|uniref:hypothetical protein n=1 Tax=Bacillus sp. FJAT-27225 TaxID=1743144 RepID=UPI00080C2AB3|nr:hypothetical protein [Bacillus sp. FJAT-27225]OCA85713.1 hypothetical protein A8F94_12625 [Bacillus sp. FJAT-27225]
MNKFEFVNKDYQMLDQKKRQFTFHDGTQVRKKPIKLVLSVAAALVVIVGTAIYFFQNDEARKNQEEGAYSASEEGNPKEQAEPAMKLEQIGLPDDFKAETLNPGIKADYKLNLRMIEENKFEASASIDIENLSSANLSNIPFNFSMNQVGELSRAKCKERVFSWAVDQCISNLKDGGAFELKSIKLNGEKMNYQFDETVVKLDLQRAFSSRTKARVDFDYTFSLPQFFTENETYNLLQWHPIVPQIDRKEWQLTSSSPGNFDFTYELVKDFHVVTSGIDPEEAQRAGMQNEKGIPEMFVMLWPHKAAKETKVKELSIRVFAEKGQESRVDQSIETAANVISFFEEKLGEYPYRQLDLILSKEREGSYPGIVFVPEKRKTVNPIYLKVEEDEHRALIYRIAQQWFHGHVEVDRFKDTWMVDGFAEFAACLYLLEHEKWSEKDSFALAQEVNDFFGVREDLNSNLPLSDYRGSMGGHFAYTRAQPAVELWRISRPYGANGGLSFLRTYLETYSGKKLSSFEFIRFSKEYFKVGDGMFAKWLDYNPYATNEGIESFKL